MTSLLDIAPSSETVDINGQKVSVYGVSAKGIASLLGRFPELRALMSGRQVDPEKLMSMGGDAVAAILAAGTGSPGDEEAERIAGLLSVEQQADLMESILRLTLPRGVGPFVEKLGKMGALLSAESQPPARPSRKPSKN